MNALTLSGKVALVTGAGSGIGREAALAFGAAGAHVVLAGRRREPLEEVAALIRSSGAEALAVRADVSASGEVAALLGQAQERFGGLDIAFNNAGIEGRFGPLESLSEADFDEVVGVNLRGAWLAMRHQAAAMKRRGGGCIVNTGSWLAVGAADGTVAYAASKGGLEAMGRAAAVELGPHGIRVNTLHPGVIDTPMFRRLGDDTVLERFGAHTPLRRNGLPRDVAGVAVWLASEAAGFITGQAFVVDGGLTIGGLR